MGFLKLFQHTFFIVPKSSVDTCMLISVYGHVFLDYKKTELHAEDVGEKCLYVYVYVYVYVHVYVYI